MPIQLRRLIVVLVGLWGIGCSTPSTAGPSPITPDASPPSTDRASVLRVDACLTALPASWQASFAGGTTMPEGMRFGLGNPSVVGTTVYGQFNTSDSGGIARLDLTSGRVEKLVSFAPGVSGTASIAVAPPWLAWTQGNARDNVFDWTVYAKNLETGDLLALAQSRQADGGFLPGQQPTLALRRTTLAWSQALPGPLTQYSSELHIFDLVARREQILATGRVSAPVYAGHLLLWGTRDAAGAYSFNAADAATLAPVATPSALRDPGTIIFLTATEDWFAWSAEGLMEVNVWRVGSGDRRSYRAPDIKHYFQFMQFAGNFMLWYSGVTSAILDLESGALVDIAGSLSAGDDLIIVEQPVGTRAVKAQVVASRVSAARTGELPRLGACSR